MRKFLLPVISAMLMHATISFALDDSELEAGQWVEKSFVIVSSTKSYDESLNKAKEAAKTLRYSLDLRDLIPDKKTGLTFSRATCEESFDSYPCYFPRGRSDDGKYVSIEYSSAFKTFAKGYYVVVIANGSVDSPMLKSSLKLARTTGYSDAYVKTDKVFLGCMH